MFPGYIDKGQGVLKFIFQHFMRLPFQPLSVLGPERRPITVLHFLSDWDSADPGIDSTASSYTRSGEARHHSAARGKAKEEVTVGS